MKKSTTIFATSLVFALSSPLALAQDQEEKKEPTKEAKGEKEEKKKADVEVIIEGNDTMQFNKKEFTAIEGQTVKLTFKNVGKLPKAAMGHNVVVLAKDTDVMAFAAKAMAGGAANDYLPQDKESKEKMLAHTKLLGPGEEESITFTAPAAGTYNYVCTFPGHVAIMKGEMKVAAKKGDAEKEEKK